MMVNLSRPVILYTISNQSLILERNPLREMHQTQRNICRPCIHSLNFFKPSLS